MKRIYGAYDDLKHNETCVRVGELIEIAKFFNISTRVIDSALKRKSKINKRFELIYLYEEN